MSPAPDALRAPVVAALLTAWCVGIGSVQSVARLPPSAPVVVAVLLAGLGALRLARADRRPLALGAGVAAVLLAGFAYGVERAHQRLADALPSAWEGEDVAIVGIVDELPQVGERSVRFAFAVERVVTPGARVPRRLSLAWVVGFPDAQRGVEVPDLHAGQRWALTVRLQRPHGLVNPGGFDLEAWLLERNLRATGYVRLDEGNRVVDAFAGRPMDHVQRARERIRERALAALPDAPHAPVLVALAIGDQSGLDDEAWRVFNRTGTGHLVSVSGLHVTVFALCAGGLAFALLRRVPAITSRVAARKLASLAGVAAAGGYVLLAGAEVPAQRTFFMLATGTAGLWLDRPGSGFTVWISALAVVLTIDPWAVLGPGFWLSFLAVGLLIYAASPRVGERRAHTRGGRLVRSIAEAAHAQWAITIGLVPLSLLLFGQVSLVGPLANAVAIPAITFAVVPVTLVAALVPPLELWPLAHALLAVLMRGLEPLAALPGAAWVQHRPLPLAMVLGALGVLLALAPRGVPGRIFGVATMLPMVLLAPARPLPGTFRVTVLDVGQGTAALVETSTRSLLYDTGPRWTEAADAGGRVIVPVLRTAGVRRLDTMVVSHRDLDHAGGALSVLQNVPVGVLLSSLDDDHPIVMRQREQGPAQRCEAGAAWRWDEVGFEVLFPQPRHYEDPARKSNDLSCVLRIGGRVAARSWPGTSRPSASSRWCSSSGPGCARTSCSCRTTAAGRRRRRPSWRRSARATPCSRWATATASATRGRMSSRDTSGRAPCCIARTAAAH